MKGDEAGLKVAQATLFLDQAHPGWRTRFRMGLLVDAGRATSIGAHIAELPQHLQNEINQHHTLSSEAALVAREARHAPADAREAIISKIPDPNMREMARAMANATPEEIVDMRTTWLVDADRAFQRLSDTATPDEKARMINEAQDRQMLANSLDDGAYVTGGAIRSVVKGQSPQTAHDSYQTLIDQIAQIGIHAHEKGGMRAGCATTRRSSTSSGSSPLSRHRASTATRASGTCTSRPSSSTTSSATRSNRRTRATSRGTT